MINLIYGLRDPRNDVYQYIGKSTVGTKRALQHLVKSHSPKVNEWINNLSENWLYPIVDIIEEVNELDKLSIREKYWIDYYYEINPGLLNIQLIDHPLQNIRGEDDEKEFDFLNKVIFNIPQILKRERLCRNLTQEEMGKHMKVSRSTISLCENGENVGISIIQRYVLTLKGIDILTKTNGDRTKRKI